MKLERKNFEGVKEKVKDELCCMVPQGVTEILENAFKDWQKLQYVYIPNSVTKIETNAFNWENIKYIFLNENDTKFVGIPENVHIIQATGNEEALFEILEEVMNFKKALEFDPKKIEETDQSLRQLTEEFQRKTSEKEERIKAKQQDAKTLLEELNTLSNKTATLTKEIQDQVTAIVNKNLEEAIQANQENIDKTYEELKKELQHFQNTVKSSEDIQGKLASLKEKLDEEIKRLAKDVKTEVKDYMQDISKEYQEKKDTILDEVVEEATKKLVQKNPCKTIIINIPEQKKKLQTTDLFHKDFDKVLKLVLTKKPVFLKGPAGSGKNVIIEQIARILNLQFRYINDVTDEFKVTGFVDANGNYIETQFFKGFTQGGVMFIDEIDNSSPSALLSINSAIGTGYNHYMSFPDGNFYKAHEDFYLIAAANTFGTGADMIYTGRQGLDGASLNRFIPVVIDYDQDLERQLVNHEEILPLFWEVRKLINENTIRHVISTRNITNASDFLDADFNLEDIFDWTIVQGMDINDLNLVCSRITTHDQFSTAFLNHAEKKYKISRRL